MPNMNITKLIEVDFVCKRGSFDNSEILPDYFQQNMLWPSALYDHMTIQGSATVVFMEN